MSSPEDRSPPLFPLDQEDSPPVSPADREQQTGFGRGLSVFMAAFALVVFGVIVWYVSDDGQSVSDSSELPVIRADSSPVRVKPDDSGGLKVEHQDKLIFGNTEPAVERLLPRPEKPVQRLLPLPAPTSHSATGDAASDPATTGRSTETRDARSTAGSEAGPAVPPAASAPEAALAVPSSSSGTVQTGESVEPDETAPTDSPVQTVKPLPAPRFRIQLGAYKDDATARSEWRRLQAAHGAQLKALRLSVMPVEVEGKGTLYRVQGGPFPEARAAATCAALQARAQACLVVSR